MARTVEDSTTYTINDMKGTNGWMKKSLAEQDRYPPFYKDSLIGESSEGLEREKLPALGICPCVDSSNLFHLR
jgi:hypothetical protein